MRVSFPTWVTMLRRRKRTLYGLNKNVSIQGSGWVFVCFLSMWSTSIFKKKFDWSNYDAFWSSRMVLVKECHNLADKTSIQGGIPIELADHVDAGLEIVVRKLCMCIRVCVLIYISHTHTHNKYIYSICCYTFLSDFQTEEFYLVFIGSSFFCSLYFVFSPIGGSEQGEN